MTFKGSTARIATGLLASLALSVLPARAQDNLTRAKSLYESADYDQALALLEKTDPAADVTTEVESYRIFCLLALGRTDEARQRIGTMLRKDPTYRPSETEASPRIRAVFQDERRRVLPQIFQDRYDQAKTSYEHREYQAAAAQFKMLLSLADDPALVSEESRGDFRMLISGFVDLAQAAIAKEAAPSPPATAGPAATGAVGANSPAPGLPPPTAAKPRVYSADDQDVRPPVAISKRIPTWRPADPRDKQTYSGVLEVVVDERGNVVTAAIRKSVYPQFDPLLVQAARGWKFQPAVKDDQPVRYSLLTGVKLVP